MMKHVFLALLVSLNFPTYAKIQCTSIDRAENFVDDPCANISEHSALCYEALDDAFVALEDAAYRNMGKSAEARNARSRIAGSIDELIADYNQAIEYINNRYLPRLKDKENTGENINGCAVQVAEVNEDINSMRRDIIELRALQRKLR